MVRLPLLEPNETRDPKTKVIAGAEHQDPRRNLWTYARKDLPEGKELHRSKFRASKHYVWDQFTLHSARVVSCTRPAPPAAAQLPRCSAEYTAPGRWVLTGLAPVLAERARHAHFERSCPRCLYSWAPYECALPPFTQRDAARCLAGRRVAFVGDSHGRVTYTHLANFLARPRVPPWDPEVKHISGRQLAVGYNTSLDLVSDILLERTDWGALRYDVVVAGFGSWALGGGGKDPEGRVHADVGRWSRARYVGRVTALAAKLGALSRRGAVPVWLGMPAYPPNQRRFAKLKGEYRTNPRIGLFNADAYAEMRRRAVRVVDAFAPSHPLVHLSIDHNHHVSYVQDAILHLLLNAICP
eukprot:TRINITY_DN24827_c0_g1_i2.p1 TRINITY_DN24827_c0_g1~~TRINITY_DN24827_c0_g1_i2.p1  ORF type:complete len:355 (+),score=100.36 TRINITY_DN24827_c0_g1_i2:767-1831(+)